LYSEYYSDFLSESNGKKIRNDYLKRIVESNEDFFPKELSLEKFKRRPDKSYEEKLKTKISILKEKGEKSKKREKKDIVSRKLSEIEVKEVEKKIVADQNLNIVEEENSDGEEEKEDYSFEDEYLQDSDEYGGDGGESENGNFSEGGD
jgi:hypothetical protein